MCKGGGSGDKELAGPGGAGAEGRLGEKEGLVGDVHLAVGVVGVGGNNGEWGGEDARKVEGEGAGVVGEEASEGVKVGGGGGAGFDLWGKGDVGAGGAEVDYAAVHACAGEEADAFVGGVVKVQDDDDAAGLVLAKKTAGFAADDD